MPSDAKKRAQQKKKEQANNRNKKSIPKVGTNVEENGTSTTNGIAKEERELTTEGNFFNVIYRTCYCNIILFQI